MTQDALAAACGRSARAELHFVSGGGRSVLARQRVPYPFHVTRPFYLDRGSAGLATLYLQSASGGLYRGDNLALCLRIDAGAGAHVTTQAGTIVHDTGVFPAHQRVAIHVEANAFLAYTPEPLVLLPGAGLIGDTTIVVAPEAAAIVSEGFAWHDLESGRRAFDRLSQHLVVNNENGRCLVRDVGSLSGRDFLGNASPLGSYKAVATTLVLAGRARLPDPALLLTAVEASGCLAGVGALPNGAGLLIRCLATDGGALRAGLASVFFESFRTLVGSAPAPRPK